MCKVDEGGRREEIGVESERDGGEAVDAVAVRCLPAKTRRISEVGAEVRRERS